MKYIIQKTYLRVLVERRRLTILILFVEISIIFNEAGIDLRIFDACFAFLTTNV
jgi:hypothetical protein